MSDQLDSLKDFLSNHHGLTIINHGTINITIPELNSQPPSSSSSLIRPPPFNVNPPPKRKKTVQSELDTQSILEQNKSLLVGWTTKQKYTLIYDSDVDGLNASSFNNIICKKRDIMCLIVTKDGYLFGCFSSAQIPEPKSDEVWIQNDPNFFVFTLTNPHHTQPMMFKLRKNDSSSFLVAPNDSRKCIFATDMCFTLKANGKVKFTPKFQENYEVPSEVNVDVFTGKYSPPIEISKLMVVHWE
ncbi:TLDc domain-containing protein [Entamoeba marina]